MKCSQDGRHVTGQMVEVYDARKWPVVRCESVHVSQTDSAHKVTQAILSTPSVHEKRRKASKYTVAVGTSHGHVQVFLKDSDLVLASLQKCPSDEKCLLLIKRPKDASRKLLKTQSLNNLSMSDTQLYRQYDRTAVNNPYMINKVKGKMTSHSDKDHVATDNSQPPVRNSVPPVASKTYKLTQAPRTNTFVPIPELGIYTPDQHVLQNGTYAQHCHNREINNNTRKTQIGYQPDNVNSSVTSSNGNFSFNSSFDDSVSSFGFQNKGVLPGFDNMNNGQKNYQMADIYHSCIDLPNSRRDIIQGFSSLSTTTLCPPDPDHNSAKNISLVNNRSSEIAKNNQPAPPIRDHERGGNIKIDPGVRSHSLGDLSSGLTFSLVGQKKSESVVTITDDSKMEVSKISNGGRNLEQTSSRKIDPVPRESGERYRGAVTGFQPGVREHSTSGKNSPKKLSSTSANESIIFSHHQLKHNSQHIEPYLKSQQLLQHHNQQQQLKQHPGSEGYPQPVQLVSSPKAYPQSVQQFSTPRTRKDSEDTISSYKSAFSEIRSPKDLDNEHHRKGTSTKPVNNSACISNTSNITSHNNSACISNTSNITSENNSACISNTSNITSNNNSKLNSSKEGCIPAKPHSTSVSDQPADRPTRDKSPVKPRRSLPNVPLNETSERIKRFTELMKSHISGSSSSSSRNCSDDGSSSKHPASRMSSIDSTCFQGDNSRKSSLEPNSVSDVFAVANNNRYDSTSESHHQNGFSHIEEISRNQTSLSQPVKVDQQQGRYNTSTAPESVPNGNRNTGYPNETSYGAKDAQIRSINRRKSYADYVGLQESSRAGHYNAQKGSVDDSCRGNREQNDYQYYNVATSGETPLPPGDRSTDSGQTVINHSFNGSALDSGYTTNNDGENDSCKSNPHHHQQNQQHQSLQQPQQQWQHSQQQQQNAQQQHSHQQQQNAQQQHLLKQHSQKQQQQHSNQQQQQNPQHHLPQQQNLPQQQYYPGRQYQHQNQQKAVSQNARKDDQSNTRNYQTNSEQNSRYPTSDRHSNNLANSRRFGSVQNISTAQAHGNPNNFNNSRNNKYSNWDKLPQATPHNSAGKENDSSCLPRDGLINQRGHKGNIYPTAIKNDAPPVNQILSQLQNQEMFRSANRRSWDYADAALGNKNDTVPANQMKSYTRADERYRSSEVMSNSKANFESNYVNTNQTAIKDSKQPNHFKKQNWAMNSTPFQNFNSNPESAKLNTIKEFPASMSHSYHGDIDYGMVGVARLHKSNNFSVPESIQLSGDHPGMVGSQSSTDFYRKSSYNQPQQEDVRPRPVPVSRSNRLARGHTLPGGFCFNDSDPSIPQLPKPSQDISLFHLAQKYDMSPLLMNLPHEKLLNDFVELSEFSVDMTMTGVPAVPNNPQGKMPQIGTPGSAFTPVRNSLDHKKTLTARLKVITFSSTKDEVHNYTTLGRLLKGDIVLEVNGWFCLGAEVDYLKKVIDNCSGAITFTVARLKESEEKRYKGQTADERIKGLESEISRLDDLILVRDHKIQILSSAPGSGSQKLHQGTLSDVNGKIPTEGMIIGGDEYVV